jgi:hypothetical protein
MNILKIALLGTAAVAAVSVSARADNLSDLKAQIETLNARVATLETAPAVPAGFSMVAISKGSIAVPGGQFKDFAHEGTMISIMPTADAPAAASTSVVTTGYVKVAAAYEGYAAPGRSYIDLRAKSGLNITGKTDTAVGEVGVSYSMAANWNGVSTLNAGSRSIRTDGVKGWWKLTSSVSLMAGQFGSISGNGKGFDGKATGNFFGGDSNGGYGLGGDPVQMQLAYADGPIGFAVAIEDGTWTHGVAPYTSGTFGFAAEATYAGDMFSAEVNAGFQPSGGAALEQAEWTVNAGLSTSFDMLTLSMAGGVGHERAIHAAGNDYSKISGFMSAKLGDSAHVEFGASEKWVSNGAAGSNFAAGAGVYYDPVKQLTVGLEASYTANTISYQTGIAATGVDLVTVFRF